MNLILLLSALLSALSGSAGTRVPITPAALSRSVASAVKATAGVRLQVASRPVRAIGRPASAVVPTLRGFVLPTIIAAFADRRRE